VFSFFLECLASVQNAKSPDSFFCLSKEDLEKLEHFLSLFRFDRVGAEDLISSKNNRFRFFLSCVGIVANQKQNFARSFVSFVRA